MRLWFARDIWRYRNVFWLIDWLIDRMVTRFETSSNVFHLWAARGIAQIPLGSSRHVSTRHDTFDVSSPCILAVSSLSKSMARHARLDALDTSNVSRRVMTSQVDFGLIYSYSHVASVSCSWVIALTSPSAYAVRLQTVYFWQPGFCSFFSSMHVFEIVIKRLNNEHYL